MQLFLINYNEWAYNKASPFITCSLLPVCRQRGNPFPRGYFWGAKSCKESADVPAEESFLSFQVREIYKTKKGFPRLLPQF